MTYLQTPEESPLYEPDLASMGYIPNYTKVFALRPEVYAAWRQLAATVQAGMSHHRYELVTLAAARRLGSRYCTLAHASVLRDRYHAEDELRTIVTDRQRAGLDPADVAAMDFADRIARDPAAARQEDIDALHAAGLSDVDIFQVVLAVSVRRFFAGVLDAVGAVPDEVYDRLDPDLRALLTAP